MLKQRVAPKCKTQQCTNHFQFQSHWLLLFFVFFGIADVFCTSGPLSKCTILWLRKFACVQQFSLRKTYEFQQIVARLSWTVVRKTIPKRSFWSLIEHRKRKIIYQTHDGQFRKMYHIHAAQLKISFFFWHTFFIIVNTRVLWCHLYYAEIFSILTQNNKE